MPIQEEATTGRPDIEGPMAAGGLGSLSPEFRGLVGRWEDYNEEERRVLQQYTGGFSRALQGSFEGLQPISDEVTEQLDAFWKTRAKYQSNKAHYSGRSRTRRRHMRGIMHALSRKAKGQRAGARAAAAKFEYKPPQWAPPEAKALPTIGDSTETRQAASPQRFAVTQRPSVAPTAEAELPSFGGVQQRMGGLRRDSLGLRAQQAGSYNKILAEQAGAAELLRSQIEAGLATTEGLDWPY